MTLFQKIAKARVDLQNKNIKKSGNNRYSGFTYYELSDILPEINNLCTELDMLTVFSITKTDDFEVGILKIIDSAKPLQIMEFRAPTAETCIGKKKDGSGGADPIQNLGGKITYMRRYLLMIAFEIVESDTVDQQQHQEQHQQQQQQQEQQQAATDTSRHPELLKWCAKKFRDCSSPPLMSEDEVLAAYLSYGNRIANVRAIDPKEWSVDVVKVMAATMNKQPLTIANHVEEFLKSMAGTSNTEQQLPEIEDKQEGVVV